MPVPACVPVIRREKECSRAGFIIKADLYRVNRSVGVVLSACGPSIENLEQRRYSVINPSLAPLLTASVRLEAFSLV